MVVPRSTSPCARARPPCDHCDHCRCSPFRYRYHCNYRRGFALAGAGVLRRTLTTAPPFLHPISLPTPGHFTSHHTRPLRLCRAHAHSHPLHSATPTLPRFSRPHPALLLSHRLSIIALKQASSCLSAAVFLPSILLIGRCTSTLRACSPWIPTDAASPRHIPPSYTRPTPNLAAFGSRSSSLTHSGTLVRLVAFLLATPLPPCDFATPAITATLALIATLAIATKPPVLRSSRSSHSAPDPLDPAN